MSETSIVQGKIEVRGEVHGALNTVIFLFDDPSDWEFKQFLSQEELEQYAAQHNLAIVKGDNV